MNKTPKLRFKEFSGDWESKKLGELGEFKKTYSFSRSVEGEGNYKHIHYGDIHMNYKGIISKDKLIPSIDIPNDDRYELIKERDIIFADASEDRRDLGKVAVVRSIAGNILSGLHTFCFRPNEFLNSEFFLNHSLNKEYLKFMYTRGNGAKVLGISKSNLAEYNFLAPSKEEQEKIASFFSLIDDKISLQGEKVEALKDYKRGMMQKIFSRELRFKDDDGRDYPEWEEKKLSELGDTYTGLSGKTKENFGFGCGKYVIYKNVFSNIMAKEDGIELVEINDGEKQNKVVKGDLLFTTSSETPNEVGMISCWNYDVDDMYLNSFCFGYRLSNSNMCNPIFMSYLLRSSVYRMKIAILAQGSTRYNISKTELMKMKVSVPDIEEQRKIVNLLLGLESNLEKNQEKLGALKEYKKGLLQQMFV